MTNKLMVIILAGFISLTLIQCTTVTVNDNAVRNKEDIKNIIKNFNSVCYAMLKEETQEVYDTYLSAACQGNQSLDDFLKEYETNKPYWKSLFSGAILKQISPVDNMASAIVVWGTGDSVLIEFAKEKDIWKINALREPISIFRGTSITPK